MTKCVLCEQRPARDGPYCSSCSTQLDRERQKNNENGKPVKFLHYRGNIVGLVQNRDKVYSPIPVKRCLAGIPKARLIDLDHYCDGFSRELIKRFKSTIAKVCGV